MMQTMELMMACLQFRRIISKGGASSSNLKTHASNLSASANNIDSHKHVMCIVHNLRLGSNRVEHGCVGPKWEVSELSCRQWIPSRYSLAAIEGLCVFTILYSLGVQDNFWRGQSVIAAACTRDLWR